MQTVKDNADIADLLEQIAQANTTNLPHLHISLSRTVSHHTVFYVTFGTAFCAVTGYLTLAAEGWLRLIFGIMCAAMACEIYQRIKSLKPSVSNNNCDDYYLNLTPQYFEVFFKDRLDRTDWRDIYTIDHMPTSRIAAAHIVIYREHREPIEIFYVNTKPIHYKKLCELIHDYWLVANHRRVIKIK